MSERVHNDTTGQPSSSQDKIVALDFTVYPMSSQTRLSQEESFQQLPPPPKVLLFDSKDECRICFESSSGLISPCICTGSTKFVHEQCLKTWLLKTMESTATGMPVENCELCGYNINFTVKDYRACSKTNASAICHQNLNIIILNFIVGAILFAAFSLTTWLVPYVLSQLLGHVKLNKLDAVAVLMIISMIAFLTIGTFLIVNVLMKLFMKIERRIDKIEPYKQPAVKI